MIILFYSEQCEFSSKLIEYLDKNNLRHHFNMINIDTMSKIPNNITIVPTIIDPTVEAPLEGNKAFEYIINQKYFYHPTNNIDYWVNNNIPKPNIDEDKKAIDRHNFDFAVFEEPKEIPVEKTPPKPLPPITDKKTLTLLKLRK
jgi:hypothetical protein